MTSVWAIADLHLSFGTPNKSMDIFGPRWKNHEARVEQHWREQVGEEDLVLIAGDISWAKTLDEAKVDLEWIHKLPGTKILLRGNHDYWWGSLAGIAKILPPSLSVIQNNAISWNHISIGGSRLWDTPEYSFSDYIPLEPRPEGLSKSIDATAPLSREETEKIFVRELHRLELSLRALDPQAPIRIAMTHYPPISAHLQPSRASGFLEQYKVDVCVFGHLHNVIPQSLPFGVRNGVQYYLTACDYLDCIPIKVAES